MPNPRPEMAMGPNVSPNRSAASTATVSGCESIITCPISHIKTQQYPCQYSQLILWSFHSCTATIALSLTRTLIQSLSLSLSLPIHFTLTVTQQRELTLPRPALVLRSPSVKNPCTKDRDLIACQRRYIIIACKHWTITTTSANRISTMSGKIINIY